MHAVKDQTAFDLVVLLQRRVSAAGTGRHRMPHLGASDTQDLVTRLAHTEAEIEVFVIHEIIASKQANLLQCGAAHQHATTADKVNYFDQLERWSQAQTMSQNVDAV